MELDMAFAIFAAAATLIVFGIAAACPQERRVLVRLRDRQPPRR
jgi:hypothetical protein